MTLSVILLLCGAIIAALLLAPFATTFLLIVITFYAIQAFSLPVAIVVVVIAYMALAK
jgi:hypothetical protein